MSFLKLASLKKSQRLTQAPQSRGRKLISSSETEEPQPTFNVMKSFEVGRENQVLDQNDVATNQENNQRVDLSQHL